MPSFVRSSRVALAALPLSLLLLSVACGDTSPAAAPPPPPAPAAPPAPAPPPPSAPAASTTAPAAPAEPTEEEKKKAKAAEQLKADRAAWEEQEKTETARWTPELHAAAKALADKTFPSAKAAVQAAIAGKHRRPDDVARDKSRHPAETLALFGLKPDMTVVDIRPGEGWYTEIVAPVVEKKGKYVATNYEPKDANDERGKFGVERWQAFLAKSPELYGKIDTVLVDAKAPHLASVPDGSVDLVMIMREVHTMKNAGNWSAWVAEIKRMLKPGGVLGIEEHRAKADANVEDTAKDGYIPEKWVIEQLEAAGFKLAGKSEVNANPKDTKDYPVGVWALPPTYRQGAKDHDKYAAIGESDRMTLKFVKK